MKKILSLVLSLYFFSSFSQFEVRYLNIVTNDLVYDPFSQRIYASIPAANGPNGNSLGVINPQTHSLVQTIFIGSEPAEIAVSDDGVYIYSGFNGSNTVRRIKLSDLSVEPPFTLGNGNFGALYAEDIEVMPGNHDVIAVSRKSLSVSPRHGGVAIFENGIMRSVITQSHTGSNRIAFSDDPNWLYGYNNESTEFGLRRLIIDSSGVKQVGLFEDIFGGFGADFIHYNNKLYSSNGKAVDVANAPFVEGQFFNMYNGAVAFDPALNLVCYAMYDWQGNIRFNRYDPQTYLLKGSITAAANGSVKSMVNCGPGCYAFNTTDNKVVIVKPSPVGINENAHEKESLFFPNPTTGLLYELGGSVSKIMITDIFGHEILLERNSERSFDLSPLTNGVYFIKGDGERGINSQKILKN